MSHSTASLIALTCSTYFPAWYQGPLRSIHHTDKIRGDLALEFIAKALEIGYWVVVTDGFSTKTFQKKLKSFGSEKMIVLQRRKNKNRSVARRQAFFRAAKIPDINVIIYSEAEKLSFLESIPLVVKPIFESEADVVVPKRDETLFQSTYPAFQYDSETEGNLLYNEYLHLHGLLPHHESLDMFFGPRVFQLNARVLALFHPKFRFQVGPHVLNEEYFNPEELSDYLFYPIILALKRKLKVKSVTIPFRYPSLQKQNEEYGKRQSFEEKRKMQRLSLLVELMHFLSLLERTKK